MRLLGILLMVFSVMAAGLGSGGHVHAMSHHGADSAGQKPPCSAHAQSTGHARTAGQRPGPMSVVMSAFAPDCPQDCPGGAACDACKSVTSLPAVSAALTLNSPSEPDRALLPVIMLSHEAKADAPPPRL